VQIPQSIHNGDLVEIRRQRWRVVGVRAYERCQLLTLAGTGAMNRGSRQRFLLPFDTVAPVDRSHALRGVRPRRWRRACRALLADWAPPGGLRAARAALIDLLPHQLEPALAVIRGRGTRLLLADDVGLGKTIQAGLVMAELQARGMAERVLIATPAGLRDQWRAELQERFSIDATIVDSREMRRRTANLPAGFNPWMTVRCAVASLDYVKRPEILQSVRSCRWDVVVVDEAHGVGPDSDRYAGISALAARAPYVLLLTATPHNGDSRAFRSLCEIGAHRDPLLVFRRTKADVHLGTGRHIHKLQIRPSASEARMHALLEEFATAARSEHDSADAWLALSVLHKRAFSSARSLELTVARRLATLASDQAAGVRQLALPLTEGDGELDGTDEPPDDLASLALADGRRERRLLQALLDAARVSAGSESKIAAIRRLLARIAEPVVVFTEFRDTLRHLRSALGVPVAILHGGLSRQERASALDDFVNGRRRILLATDAAGEGLNLHQRCRTVINVELPWNPMRLEQRIGRVDRIGQRRSVHVFHLVGRATGEVRVLERLKARIARARTDIPAADPIEDDERVTARFVIDRRCDEATLVEPEAEAIASMADARVPIDMGSEARQEASRLAGARMLWCEADANALAALEITGPWIAMTRLRTTRLRLQQRVVAIMRVEHEDGRGRLLESTLVPMTFAIADRALHRQRGIRAILDVAATTLQSRAAEAAHESHREIARLADDFMSTFLARERRIAEAVRVDTGNLVQPGLFDRRAERAHAMSRAAIDDAVDNIDSRIDIGDTAGILSQRPARLLLVLVP
jgi:superfamily II DNA or RNA helicase